MLAEVASAILHSPLRSCADEGDSRESLRATARAGVALICGTHSERQPKPARNRAGGTPPRRPARSAHETQIEALTGSFSDKRTRREHHAVRHLASATTSFFGISFKLVNVSAICC